MNIQQILDSVKNNELTEEQQKTFIAELNTEMVQIKEKDPKKYLEFLKTINEAVAELKIALKS